MARRDQSLRERTMGKKEISGTGMVERLLRTEIFNFSFFCIYFYFQPPPPRHPSTPPPPVAQMVEEFTCNAGDPGSIPELGRFPGEGNGNPLQYFCLKNPMDRAAQQATVHGVVKELDTTQRLNNKNNNIHCTTSSYFCYFHVNFLHCLVSSIKVVNTQNFESVVFGEVHKVRCMCRKQGHVQQGAIAMVVLMYQQGNHRPN